MSEAFTKTGDKSQDEKILMPYTYILQVPGKQIRKKLSLAFNYWLRVSDDKLRAIGEIVQMLHNSSLLVDDIQDNSILRRGIPVAHSIYGIASTINAANYAMIIALEKTLELGHPQATAVYTEQLLQLHRGQGMEIYWRDNFHCPSEDEYKQMTIKKTGGLFMLAIRLMQLFSENKSDFSRLSSILGLYFQIRDDYCNLCLQEATAVYTEQLLQLHRGQGMEIYWRDNFHCPSEDEYKQMTIKKTGGLFMLAIRLMQLFSENKSDFSRLSSILGLYFQIRDDYCNLCLQEYSENKSYCEDLTEGKFSFPIVHAIRTQHADNQVLHILRQRTRDVEVKRYCVSLLERLGSFQYTRDALQALDADARAEVARLGGNPLLEALLDELLSWRRDKKCVGYTEE
ncbi:Geranylgeranyl pyrophosphate synthase [Papilio machaon]|uniref:Geranylgeranyl pyrophosphate synthase n=1 Tax=Papilio machaon TaxID=76193 RepID=A0A194QSD4_PAPMA|nr:Geranylgeranyl pyrophosphate synthase [Papilio machaon]